MKGTTRALGNVLVLVVACMWCVSAQLEHDVAKLEKDVDSMLSQSSFSASASALSFAISDPTPVTTTSVQLELSIPVPPLPLLSVDLRTAVAITSTHAQGQGKSRGVPAGSSITGTQRVALSLSLKRIATVSIYLDITQQLKVKTKGKTVVDAGKALAFFVAMKGSAEIRNKFTVALQEVSDTFNDLSVNSPKTLGLATVAHTLQVLLEDRYLDRTYGTSWSVVEAAEGGMKMKDLQKFHGMNLFGAFKQPSSTLRTMKLSKVELAIADACLDFVGMMKMKRKHVKSSVLFGTCVDFLAGSTIIPAFHHIRFLLDVHYGRGEHSKWRTLGSRASAYEQAVGQQVDRVVPGKMAEWYAGSFYKVRLEVQKIKGYMRGVITKLPRHDMYGRLGRIGDEFGHTVEDALTTFSAWAEREVKNINCDFDAEVQFAVGVGGGVGGIGGENEVHVEVGAGMGVAVSVNAATPRDATWSTHTVLSGQLQATVAGFDVSLGASHKTTHRAATTAETITATVELVFPTDLGLSHLKHTGGRLATTSAHVQLVKHLIESIQAAMHRRSSSTSGLASTLRTLPNTVRHLVASAALTAVDANKHGIMVLVLEWEKHHGVFTLTNPPKVTLGVSPGANDMLGRLNHIPNLDVSVAMFHAYQYTLRV